MVDIGVEWIFEELPRVRVHVGGKSFRSRRGGCFHRVRALGTRSCAFDRGDADVRGVGVTVEGDFLNGLEGGESAPRGFGAHHGRARRTGLVLNRG